MKLVSLVEKVIVRLSVIPGLGFLQSYVQELHGRHTAIEQKIGAYRGYVRAARDAGAEVSQATRGAKKEEEPDDEDFAEEYEEDDESYLQ
jgi:hypothetical protein